MTSLTKEQRKWLNKCVIILGIKGSWTLNPKTGLVDVEKDFICRSQGLTDFKGVKFGRVGGFFWCDNNRLTSLEGAPQEVGGHFNCAGNRLISLVGAPQEVGGHFDCVGNRLISLVGAPKRVGGSFWCSYSQLTSLEGAPQNVGGSFYCGNNRLTSLEGAPLKVGGEFWCDANPVSQKTLITMFSKMKKGDSFWVAATSLKNKMSKKDWKLVATNIPEAIRPGVSMLGRFGLFN